MFGRRSSLRSKKFQERKRKVLILKVFLAFALLFALLSGVLYGLHRPEVTIQNIGVVGEDVIPAQAITTLAREVLTGNYFWIIPRSTIFFYPRGAIEAALPRVYPKIKEASTSFKNLTTIEIVVEERQPFALWCGENRLEGAIPKCFFLDETGFIYGPAPDFTGDVYFHYYGSLPKSDPVGQHFLSQEEFSRLSFFFIALVERGINARDFAVRDDTDYEFYLDNGIQVLFAREQDLTLLLQNLESVLISEKLKNVDLATVEYIDLRFGNKVFYKMAPSE